MTQRSKASNGNKTLSKDVSVDDNKVIEGSWVQEMAKFDTYLTNAFAICATSQSRYGHLRPVMKFLELSAHGVPWIFGTLLIIVGSHQLPFQVKMINLLWAMIIDMAVVGTTKAIVRRERPALNKMDMFGTVSIDKFSFPSGHTTRAAMTALFFMDHFCSGTTCGILITMWTVLIGVSRVLLGRHHVFDVGCGFIIGALVYQHVLLRLWLSEHVCQNLLTYVHEYLHV